MKNLLILLLVGCAKIKHDVTPVDINTDLPDTITLDLGFEKAAQFCDERYGYKTIEAEQCFKEYRSFAKFSLGVDLTSIISFCEGSYSSDNDVNDCVNDLTDLISKFIQGSTL